MENYYTAAQKFIQGRTLDTVKLDGVTFYVNPFQYEFTTEFLSTDVPTLGGNYYHIIFGHKPGIHQFSGFTGIQGLEGITNLNAVRALADHHQRLVKFYYPARFGKEYRNVYVQTFTDSMSSEMHLYHQYQITLIDYHDQAQSPYTPVPGSVGLSIANVITVTNPTGTRLVPVGPAGTPDTSDPGKVV